MVLGGAGSGISPGLSGRHENPPPGADSFALPLMSGYRSKQESLLNIMILARKQRQQTISPGRRLT
jgi:hypothetical protein